MKKIFITLTVLAFIIGFSITAADARRGNNVQHKRPHITKHSPQHNNGYRYNHYGKRHYRPNHYRGHWKSYRSWDNHYRTHSHEYRNGRYYRDSYGHLYFLFGNPGSTFGFSIGR